MGAWLDSFVTAIGVSGTGRKAIAQCEGNKLVFYLDSVSIWTVGDSRNPHNAFFPR